MSVSSSNKGWFRDPVKRQRVWMMAGIEFKLRYYENKLGLIWALIKPALNVLIYFTVFQVIMGQRIENYALYLFLGLIVWQFFAEGTGGLIRVLQTKKYLYDHTTMEKSEIYVASMMSNVIGFCINLVVFLIGFFLMGLTPGWTIVLFPLVFLNLIILTMGIALILSHLFLLFKDISQIWSLVTMAGFFLSPIFYLEDRFSETLPLMNYINPMSGIIINSRNTIMYGKMPDWTLLGFDFLFAFILLALGIQCLKKLSPKASELI